MLQRAPLSALISAGALALTGCGGAEAGAADAGEGLQVVAAFYPLQFVTERVAGDRATVSGLTAPGAEPHDLELSPRAVGSLADADLVVYESGFQPAVDDAVTADGGENGFDVVPAADLELAGAADDHEEHADGGEHADGRHAGGEEHAEGSGTDPHFWLDPSRLSAVGQAVADRLAEVDPDGAQQFATNAEGLAADLTALDAELEAGLASCASRDLVTSHEAFGYLADRYGFEQVGISGLSPDEEPDAGRVAEVADLVRERGVRTIYFETLVSPAVAEAVAAETSAATAVLDPIEGLGPDSAGDDYLAVQRANLQALRLGQSCS